MNKTEIKKKLTELVGKYKIIVKSGRISKYNEEETKKDFILPLFQILGWDVFDSNEVSAEESQSSGGRVDYGFYIDSRPKFYLEAKPFKADIQNEDYAKQAIRYSWNKGITWAILTNFKRIIVFNASNTDGLLGDKLLFSINYSEYLERFDQLWQLSREAFKEDSIDKYAEQIGKKLQKVSVNTALYKDISSCRDILTNSISKCNPKVDKDLIDEGIQRLLDRLIFIRVAEDRKIESPTLIPILHKWESKGRGSIPLYQAMINKFREFDKIYNSNLFSEHSFENWEEYGGAMEKVIPILYGKKGYYEYDFKVMPADVLGGIYENYLGYRLSKSKKGTTISKDAKKRKEQGIYYTPTFIVDYIVRNALKPVLNKCQSIHDLKKIKVLDPACGSGSFLIKAFEVINEKYKQLHYDNAYIKLQILTENIYGVDLDEQAVEIARLNLLISALDSKNRLPILTNIKNGNSLISGTDKELKKYFGPNFRDKKPFNWEEEFPEVFAQGGFDVIIGNPPYGAELSKEDQNFFKNKYNIGSTDTAILFVKKSFTELKNGGFLGFIIPKAFTFASNYEKIRELVWDNVKAIIDGSKVWREVKLEQVVVIVEKEIIHKTYQGGFAKDNQIFITDIIDKKITKSFNLFPSDISKKELKIGSKILKTGNFLGEFVTNKRGVILNKFVEHGKYAVIGGKEINRYEIKNIRGYINDDLSKTTAKIQQNSILVQGIVAHIENPIDHIKITANIPTSMEYFIADNINQLVLKKEFSNYFIWALLNSQLINWYCYRFIYGKSIRTMRFDNPVTDRIPISNIFSKNQTNIVKLAKKLLDLHKTLENMIKNSNKWDSIKSEIEKTDKKIDEEVYKLYGLTPKEIKIVEFSK